MNFNCVTYFRRSKKIKFQIILLFMLSIFSLYFYNQKINKISSLIPSYLDFKYPRIYCIVLTIPQNLKTKTKLIYDLWVNKCDGHKFISIIPDEYLNNHPNIELINKTGFEINIGFDVLQPPNYMKESYGKLTDKIFNAFKYIYQQSPQFDFYLKADEDTFIFVDNLRSFLSTKDRKSPVTYGYNFRIIVKNGYHSGGAGYVLSNEALSRLGNALIKNTTKFDISQLEDIDVASALRKLNVLPGSSIDENGRERFHPTSIKNHYEGNNIDWLNTYAENRPKKVKNYF